MWVCCVCWSRTVLVQDAGDEAVVEVGERDDGVDLEAAARLDVEGDVGRAAVQADAHRLQLLLEQPPLHRALRRVQHHDDQVRRARHRNHLPAAALALARTLNDARQIQQLNVCTAVLYDTGDARQSGELVGRDGRLGLGELRQDRGLAHGGEADERDARVAVLLHLEAVAAALALAGGLQQHRAVAGELRLEQAEVMLRRLVLLRASHLVLDLLQPHPSGAPKGGPRAHLNLLKDTHLVHTPPDYSTN